MMLRGIANLWGRMFRILNILLAILVFSTTAFAGVDFDNADDVLDCGSGTSLDDLTALTIAVWANPDSMGEGTLGRFTDKTVQLFLNRTSTSPVTTKSLLFQLNCATTNITRHSADNVVVTGEWHHYAVTWSGGTTASTSVKFYKDGVETSYNATSTNCTGARTSDATNSLLIGNSSGATRTFDGKIGEVAIWSSELTAAQIASLVTDTKRMPLQVSKSTLVGYWDLLDEEDGSSADGDIFYDGSGSANNCTGSDGANNTGLTAKAEEVLSYA